jgi:hypothetical protein
MTQKTRPLSYIPARLEEAWETSMTQKTPVSIRPTLWQRRGYSCANFPDEIVGEWPVIRS